MSVRQQNNVNFAVVGGTASLSTGAVLNDGEIGLFKANGTRLTTAGAVAGEKFYIALGGANGKPSFVSDVIDGSKLTSITTKAPVDAAEQVDYIGFNGVSGNIEAIASNLYMATVHIQEYLTSSTDGRYIKHFQYKTASSGETAHTIATGLISSGIKNFSREAEDYLGFGLLSDEAGTSLTATTGNLSITNGSKILTASVDIDGEMAVGDYIRLSEDGTTAAALTDPIYKIVSVNTTANTAVLDRPFEGVTYSAVAPGTLADFITAAAQASADCGVRLKGKALAFDLGKVFYKKVRWDLQIGAGDGMGSTAITNSVGAAEGSGQYEQVAELEWFAAGNRGEYFRMGEPSIYSYDKKASSAVAGGGYDITAIDYVDDSVVGIGATPTSKKQITLCTPTTLPGYMNATDDVWAILDAIYAGTVTPV